MDRAQEQFIHEQVTAKAKHGAKVVATTGRVVRTGFVNAVRTAETTGGKAVEFGTLAGGRLFRAVVQLVWVSCRQGFRAAMDGSAVFWLHPLSMLACFFISLSTRSGQAHERIMAVRWHIQIGSVWFTHA